MREQHIKLNLNQDEAIVLFDFLTRLNEQDKASGINHKAEEQVLWNLECMLEKKLSVILQANYSKMLEAARQTICQTDDD